MEMIIPPNFNKSSIVCLPITYPSSKPVILRLQGHSGGGLYCIKLSGKHIHIQ